MTGFSRDYTGRQLDLEIMQGVAVPSGTVQLTLTATDGSSRAATGMQKALQRYTALLLTPTASVPFPAVTGNYLLEALRTGVVPDAGYLRHLFNMANSAAIDTMRADDYNIERFGEQPADERIVSVELSNITVDYGTSTLRLDLTFRTEAGSDYTYVLPISTRQE